MHLLKKSLMAVGMLALGLAALNLLTKQFLPGVRGWLGLAG